MSSNRELQDASKGLWKIITAVTILIATFSFQHGCSYLIGESSVRKSQEAAFDRDRREVEKFERRAIRAHEVTEVLPEIAKNEATRISTLPRIRSEELGAKLLYTLSEQNFQTSKNDEATLSAFNGDPPVCRQLQEHIRKEAEMWQLFAQLYSSDDASNDQRAKIKAALAVRVSDMEAGSAKLEEALRIEIADDTEESTYATRQSALMQTKAREIGAQNRLAYFEVYFSLLLLVACIYLLWKLTYQKEPTETPISGQNCKER